MRCVVVVAACVGVVGLCGCAAPAIVATAGLSVAQFGASSYVNGKLDSARRVPIEDAYKASVAAMIPLGLEIEESHEPDEEDAYIATRQNDGTPIAIRLRRVSPAVSKVEIRVGTFGDHSLSRLIMANIDEQLREMGHTMGENVTPQP